jgi:hypothetical protein
MKRMKKFLALSSLEKRSLIAAVVMLPVCAAGLRILGFRRTREQMLGGRPGSASRLASEDMQLAQGISRAVDIAAAHGPYRAKCLARSLVLARFLGKHGISCEIKIGAAVTDEDFSAHAWVVSGDVVLNDAPEVSERFGVFEPASKGSA